MYSLKAIGVYLEITSICNRRCPYCYNDSSAKGTHLPLDTIRNILQECSECGIQQITISGGEPFLHPEIDKIGDSLLQYGIQAVFITNLSILPLNKILELAQQGHRFQVTLDSTDCCRNDLTRGTGSFDLVMNLLKQAKAAGVSQSIILRFNLSKNNTNEIQDVVELACRSGIKYLEFGFLYHTGRGKNYAPIFSYESDILLIHEISKELRQLQKKYSSDLAISYTTVENQVGCVLYGDGELGLGIKIEPNGDVFACQLFSGNENILGNVLNSRIQTVLDSPMAHSVVDQVRMRKRNQTDCAKCAFTEFCMCGCPAISYNQSGDINLVSDQCSMIKYFMKEKLKHLGNNLQLQL